MQHDSRSQVPASNKSKGKLKRQRAGAACVTCRQRRVRCDGSIVGVPCTNCRLDTLDCGMRAQLSDSDMFYRFLDFSALKDAQIDGMGYLISKGCFHLPKRPHLDELVRYYFYSVHHHLPVLNEEEFGFLCTGTTCESDTQSASSVLVLQAMLFAASAVCILIVEWKRILAKLQISLLLYLL